jgi:uncharacterized protein DUF5680
MEDLGELPEFLVTAKRNTFASGSKGTKEKDHSTLYEYEKDQWEYQDQFYGDGDHFLGHETVWKKTRPVWGMNYHGVRLDKLFEEKRLYALLREALKRVEPSRPFRGPEKYESNNLRYSNVITGDLGSFRGVEFIYETGRILYQLDYHGGILGTVA